MRLKSKKWDILIVDDEKDVHKITKMVLRNFDFQGKSLNILSAYSAMEARKVLKEETDIALILLDVVMEEKNSGLELINEIRETNKLVRITIRTGQPGEAPERTVIREYDIHDYLEKGDIEARRLETMVCSALRIYEAQKTICQLKNDIERRLEACERHVNAWCLSSNASNIRELVDAVYRIFAGEPTIRNAALFFEDKVVKKSDDNKSMTKIEKAYSCFKEKNQMYDVIDGFVFVRVREFVNYVFVAECDDIGEQFANTVVIQAIGLRRNFVKLLQNKSLVRLLTQVVDAMITFDYIKPVGNKIRIIGAKEETAINFPFGELFLYFDEDKLCQIGRSLAVNPKKVVKLDVVKTREVYLIMKTGKRLRVPRGGIHTAFKKFQTSE